MWDRLRNWFRRNSDELIRDILSRSVVELLLWGLLTVLALVVASIGPLQILRSLGMAAADLLSYLGLPTTYLTHLYDVHFHQWLIAILTTIAIIGVAVSSLIALSNAFRAALSPAYIRPWVTAVRHVVLDHNRGLNRAMIKSFFSTYARQEAFHLLGRIRDTSLRTRITGRKSVSSSKHRVYTSFVSYSELVRAVVEKGISSNGAPTDKLICITSLSMPLPQWFNNKKNLASAFPYEEIDTDWNKYLIFMNSLVSDRKITLYRMIQVYSAARSSLDSGYPFGDELGMKEMARAKILLPVTTKGHLDREKALRPFDLSARKGLNIEGDEITVKAIKKFIAETYGDRVGLSYIVLPSNEQCCSIEGYDWMPIQEAFDDLFCPEDRSFVYRIDKATYGRDHTGDDAMPHDFFLLGFCPDGDVTKMTRSNWQFCLAASVDSECQMVRLEYMTRKIGNGRLDQIVDYVHPKLTDFIGEKHKDSILSLKQWVNG
jgi:hypothetical protein